MAFLINPAGLVEYTFTLDNTQLQNIVAFTPILLKDTTNRIFGIVGVTIKYVNATTQFKTSIAGGYGYVLIGGVLMGVYQNASGSSFVINPGFAVSYQVNYDETGPLFCSEFRGDSIELSFDGNYSQGDGELVIKVVGFYL